MKILYLDLRMGAAGDMLTAALAELFDDREKITAELNALGLPGVIYRLSPAEKCGITGSNMRVSVNGEEETPETHGDHHHGHDGPHHDGHAHTRMEEIRELIRALPVSEAVRANALAVYGLIADAESRVHGKPVEEIHFHEVGTMDAVADVVAVCYLLERLSPDRITASPVHVGGGTVRCAHGILPVPAPATALLLEGIPTYGGAIQSELCTPTGAALLRRFVQEFIPQPLMAVGRIGYGMGKKDFAQANCLRALLGETAADAEEILELTCNVDDMTAERIAFACERLYEAGAKEAFTVPAGMKKSRPGTWIHVLCAPEDRDAVLRCLFRHTATIGVRESVQRRYTLSRRIETAETPWGGVRKKISSGWGVTREKWEYEDLARVAKTLDLTLEEAAARIGESGTQRCGASKK